MPGRRVGGIVVGADVGDGGGVEHHEIGEGPHPDHAPVDEPERLRRERRHPPHGILQRDDRVVAGIAPEHAREGPPQPGVLLPRRGHAVTADHRARVPEDGAHVVLAHHVQHDERVAVGRDDGIGRLPG